MYVEIYLAVNLDTMGLFDKLFSSSAPVTWEPANSLEAWACCLYALGSLDGNLSDVEIDQMTRSLVETRPFSGLDIASMISPMLVELNSAGWADLCIKAASRVDVQHAETAFCMACEMAMRDGETTEQEQNALERLAHAMGLEEARAKRIVDTYIARYKFQMRVY